MYKRYFKRLLDFLVSLIALIILSPILILVALLIRLKLGKPVIFSVERPGKDEKIFTMYKFRTMSNTRDLKGELLPDADRLTLFGMVLRRSSLDELPELFNILKGDMSLVGPRPLAKQYLEFYSDVEKLRHTVRPGLTGLAQINGRNDINWESKFAYDVAYVDKLSFLVDLKILLITISKVIKGKNIGTRGIDAPEDFDKYRTRQIMEHRKERIYL